MDQEVIATEDLGCSAEAARARYLLAMMVARREPYAPHWLVPPIEDVKYIEDGNLTMAVVQTENSEFIGWAKFNPSDLKVLKQTSKKGKKYIRVETKFNAKAGRSKALHRALEKMVPTKKR